MFGNTFINCEHTDPNSAWNMFKIELNRLSSLHIPTKMCKSRRDLPWITPQIIRLIRKRDKMYTKLKHPNTSVTTKQFKDLKYNIQNQIRNAYWLYSSTCHGRPPLVQRISGPSWQVAPRDRERTYMRHYVKSNTHIRQHIFHSTCTTL